MASFNIVSLFINISLDETIDIICSKLFSNTRSYAGMHEQTFRQFLNLACKESFFIFNGRAYRQTEGLSMGAPHASTFANIFLCHNETQWLKDCPDSFKPSVYKRYVDDTFLLFKSADHASQFLDYINDKHANIKFTRDDEQNRHLPFLDINIERGDCKFNTSIYRKPTFTGLGLNYFSNVCTIFKLNNVKILLYRAYHLSSTFTLFHREIEFLKKYFITNGYPENVFDNMCRKFLDKIYSPTDTIYTADKLPFYFVLPYYNKQCETIANKMKLALQDLYPQISFNCILRNTSNLASFFSYKDRIPQTVLSNVIYQFTCRSCNASYIGSTQQKLKTRICQHLGISNRTGRQLTTVMQSEPRNHAHQTDHPISYDDFKIIDTAPRNLHILESLHILKLNPDLNNHASAAPLYIIKKSDPFP